MTWPQGRGPIEPARRPLSLGEAGFDKRSGVGQAVSKPWPELRGSDLARRFRAPHDLSPVNDFLMHLQREKRRAERHHAPLALILYRTDVAGFSDPQQTEQLLEVLHTNKRETDFLGYVADDLIAVLCPDTDEVGTKGFMEKVEREARGTGFAALAAMYPDELFETINSGTRAQPAFTPFFAADHASTTNGYRLKRSLDVVGATVAILLLWPIMLLVAAAVGLTSRGPIVFKQVRVGQGGAPFTFYKFRSMITKADDFIHREYVAKLISDQLPAYAGGPEPQFKIKRDPRVTAVGRFIRRTSLDELPQFFNVLKGDMSLVGPRPPIPYEAAQYQAWHLRRLLTLKPGITGIWQVEGRSRVTFNDMVRMDLRYIRTCSLALDLKLLLKTLTVVVNGNGAD
jgi:lipopolysaccharide/colanic/teichoic acid biosynthesis glycosyltransferase